MRPSLLRSAGVGRWASLAWKAHELQRFNATKERGEARKAELLGELAKDRARHVQIDRLLAAAGREEPGV